MAAVVAGPVGEMFQRYHQDLQSTVETIRHRTIQLSEDAQKVYQQAQAKLEDVKSAQSQLESFQKTTVEVIQDSTDVTTEDRLYLVESYLWFSVCLFGVLLGSLIGHSTFWFLHFFFRTSSVFMLAFILLPLWLYLYNQKSQTATDTDRRLVALSFSIAVGSLIGHFAHEHQLAFWAPPAFLFPLSVGVTSGLLNMPSRPTIIGAAAVGAFGLCVAWGAVIVGMPLGYIIWSVLLTAMIAIDAQLKIAQRRQDLLSPATQQLITILSHVVLLTTMHVIFGKSTKQLILQQEETAATVV